MTEGTSTPPRTRSGWVLSALPAVTFLVGAVLGGVFVGVGLHSDDSSSSPTATPPSPSSSPTAASGSDTAVILPAACSEAAAKVSEAIGLLRQGAAAIGDFQPKELTQVLNQLEDLDPQLRELAGQCSAVEVQPTDAS